MRNRGTVEAGSLVAVVAVGLLGCDGSGGVPVDKTADELSAAICRRAYECCTAEQLMKNDSAGSTVAECERYTSRDLRNLLERIQSSHAASRARYEPDRVQACLTSLQTSSCAALNETNHLTGVPGCSSFVSPLVPAGGVCKEDYECIAGTCVLPEDAVPGTSGTCVAAATAGSTSAASRASAPAASPPGASSPAASTAFRQTAAASPPPAQCFYENGCAVAGNDPPAYALVGLLLLLGVSRMRTRRTVNHVR